MRLRQRWEFRPYRPRRSPPTGERRRGFPRETPAIARCAKATRASRAKTVGQEPRPVPASRTVRAGSNLVVTNSRNAFGVLTLLNPACSSPRPDSASSQMGFPFLPYCAQIRFAL